MFKIKTYNAIAVQGLERFGRDRYEVGGDIGWGDVPDGHTWTTWRDLLDPHLTRLLQEAWH